MIDDDTDIDAALPDAQPIYRRMRRDYDDLIAAVERLQNHHGLFLLRQAACAAKLAPRPYRPLTTQAPNGDVPDAETAMEAVPERLSGSAIRYYAAEMLALLSDLQQRAMDLQALAVLLPAGAAAPATWPPQGPGLTQMLSESQRLLLKAECDIQPLISRLLTATAMFESAKGRSTHPH